MAHDKDPGTLGAAVTVAGLQGLLLEPVAATEAVRQLAEVARDLVPTATGAGVTLVDDHGVPASTAATDPLVEQLDALQYELGEGPCLTAWDTVTTQSVPDTTTDLRWAEWAVAAAAAGVGSVLSVPLLHHGKEIGAVKIYAAEPQAFTEHEEHLLQLLATAAAALLGSAATTESLRRTTAALQATLAERQALQRAIGVLMERHDLEPEAAHALLVRAAGEQRTTVHDLAVRVVHRSDDPRV
ncbi:GAF and ANTAR domain-containing protein [Kocuria sp. LUK]|uniref:GAF and ANTAR domain-containing protein n=1 Tax=Kocuria sp. LUK TaxID=2897828 RepID=UPI001E4398BC|nr:GAF and ANTAR domain-containing protein [Kocuria sp. LUK]MCD1144968.1 GAF and ANTAR domain-containing protein [Kocuria sp. LUK]